MRSNATSGGEGVDASVEAAVFPVPEPIRQQDADTLRLIRHAPMIAVRCSAWASVSCSSSSWLCC